MESADAVDKKISIDPGTIIEIVADGETARLKYVMVGMDSDKYLIISPKEMMPPDKLKVTLTKGKALVARYIQSGNVIGFQSEILLSIFEPFQIIFIKYPHSVEEHSFREYERQDCHLPSKVVIGYNIFNGSISDISKGGCCFMIKMDNLIGGNILNKSDKINLKLQLPGKSEELTLPGEVRSMTKAKGLLKLGVRFDELNDKTKEKLNQFLEAAF